VKNARVKQLNVWNGFVFDNPAQVNFLRSPAKVRLLSSGYGGGKTKLACRENIRVSLDYPGSRNLIARLKNTELQATTFQTFKRELSEIGLVAGRDYTYNKNDGIHYWHNGPGGGPEGGSQTIWSHLESDEKFGSSEFSSICVDEGSQVPDDIYHVLIPGRLRWPVGPHRAWICTNPGASGFLREIVYGTLKGTGAISEWTTVAGRVEKVVDEFGFFPVPIGGNKHNPAGYNESLALYGKRYGPHWFARYVAGDWDSFEGQRFPMFDRDKHVLATPWRPTPHHEVVMGIDFGHQVTHVCWIAFDPRGIEPVVCFDELEVKEVDRPEDVVNQIKRVEANYGISDRVMRLGDPAGVASTQFSSVTVIGAYAALGIYIAPCKAGKDPLARADLVASHLTAQKRQPDGSVWPGLLFSPSCARTIHSITNLRWDLTSNTKGEDPREKFLNRDKHGFDSFSYGLVGVPPPPDPEAPRPRDLSLGIDGQTALREWVKGGV
jgi:hypothetical protein